MGKRMSATPTPKSRVWQGVANTPNKQVPHPLHPLKGVCMGGEAASPVSREVGQPLRQSYEGSSNDH